LRILAISAHPDDETLGCGGTLLNHKKKGDELHWLIVTKAFQPKWSEATVLAKEQEVNIVAESYGFESVHNLRMPPASLDRVPKLDIIQGACDTLDRVRPAIIYVVHDGDVHTDHHDVFVALFSSVKSFYMNKWGVKRILSYETLSSTEAAPPQHYRSFNPNVYVNISPFLEKKIEIMNLYSSEIHSDLMPRGPSAIKALARYRGATIAVEYAEAFMLIREIIDAYE